MKPERNPVILTIDDEKVIRDSIQAYLEDFDYTVLTAENGAEGLKIVANESVDLILVDLRMPQVDGLEVLTVVREEYPDMPILVVSGTGDISDVVEALRLGAWDYLLKPMSDLSILKHSIEKCLERASLIRENRQYQVSLEELVGRKTQELSEVNERLKRVVESTKRLLGSTSLDESGPLLLNEFSLHMDATGGSLYKVTDGGLRHIAALDNGHAPEVIPFPLDAASVFARVLEEKEPLFLDDIEREASVVPSGWQKYRDNSLLVFPILGSEGDVMAVISLHSKKVPPFNSQDRDIGKILASYTSEAMQMAKVSKALQSSEERLRQAQKMEAIGTLAGGIAHDFNNILAAIIGYTDLSLFSGGCNETVRRNLEQVKNASNRAKDLVAQILAFSRTEEFKEKAVDIGPIIKEALKLLRATIPSSVVIESSISDGLGRIQTDPTKIYQVLMNLCTNAVHAMGSEDGVLTITFAKASVAESPAEVRNSLHENWLLLSISDTGTGISREHLERIFDPYFTTKEKGEGTGLGLAVVHGIVRASGGVIQVESKRGQGSTFKLFFPATAIQERSDEHVLLQEMEGGTERLLLVDDEVTLAEMAGEMLTTLGYSVSVMSNAKEAYDHISGTPNGIDLLITDQTMPEMTGMELAKKALKIRPDLPVILYTGYSAAIDATEARKIGIRRFLMKPLSMSFLADVVRKTLDA